MKKVTSVSTDDPTLRSEIWGWNNVENPSIYKHDKMIGFTASEPCINANTVLEALADDWELLGPPMQDGSHFLWWLTKEIQK